VRRTPSARHRRTAWRPGATLDLAGFNQTVASLANSGTVSLVGATAGTTLTVNGNYVGNNGVLKLGTALSGTGPSDRLVINGGTASGKTSVQVTNLGGLGALTAGNGIEVVTAQRRRDDHGADHQGRLLAGGRPCRCGCLRVPPVRGRCERRGRELVPAFEPPAVDAAHGPGTPAVPVVTYRPEASLFASLPSQLRQGNLAMLGDLRKRVGDDDVKGAATTPTGSDRRAWARVLSTDIDIQQGGAVSPTSKGRLTGFQAGTDLLATPNWRAGLYVGQLDGDARVNGFASGIQNLGVGRNDLRSQYVGIYGTYTADSGFYADAVVQSGRHRYTVEPLVSLGIGGKGNSLLGSIEVGQAFALGGSGWSIEPQLQLIHQHMDFGNSVIAGAVVQPQADSGWIARAGVRVKGQIDTGVGTLQPYGRFNVYKTSSGADIARFVNGATTTDIAAPTGGTSTELAGGFTLALSPSTSLYGELGKLWASGGNAKVKSSINGSLGRAGEVVKSAGGSTERQVAQIVQDHEVDAQQACECRRNLDQLTRFAFGLPSDIALSVQQRQRILCGLHPVAAQEGLGLFDERVPQVQVVALQLNGGVLQHELPGQIGIEARCPDLLEQAGCGLPGE
jgi:fibronectin-binding autotransporter adhesin